MAEYISRNAVITTIKNYGKGAIAEGVKTLDPVDDIVALAEAIKWLQITDVAPVVHGRWEWYTADIYRCIVCGGKAHVKEVMFRPAWSFCPNCGARMDEVSE